MKFYWERVNGRWVLIKSSPLPRHTFRQWFPLGFSVFAVILAVWNLIR